MIIQGNLIFISKKICLKTCINLLNTEIITIYNMINTSFILNLSKYLNLFVTHELYCGMTKTCKIIENADRD